ncbi:hypothetical protein [Pseudobacteriovorax antillogorgiicola]|uniref:Uncharacterized protein n=1 Tax=Pseudobacteriovorax antillogorgiicola TaxID=1513793 RepID=A0A1Y6CLH6_9BACT|nr:hypothetical protein [Pseudobacteriovorax antillogorgiicola]TCS45881.1 hypothetical protein EDD56_12644 [Pseudobacteriovorax antillogorgiicola]SMF71227.1 hypothetical protein SAMN06296036_12654 [Pseudobacteriovorax antillogorgiicola]
MDDSILYLAVAAAAFALVYAFLTRKQFLNSKALAREASAQVDKTQKKVQKLENQASQHQKAVQQLRDSLQAAEKKLAESQKRLHSKDDDVAKVKADFDAQLVIETRKRDHVEEQNKALTEQLAQAVREKKEAQTEAEQLSSKAVSKDELKSAKGDLEKLQKQLQQARKENKSLKHQVEKAREILSKVKPGELKRLKVKANRMEQLYTSMKGLREMAEERNQNWETALRLMAVHITGKSVDDKAATAPLVGEALEAIGSNLVHDEHTFGSEEAPGTEKASPEDTADVPQEASREAPNEPEDDKSIPATTPTETVETL